MLLNQTTGKIISKNEIVCKTVFSRARGLMFRKRHNLIMILPEELKISLHMFFVFYPIGVFITDRNGRIVEIKRNFRPFTFWNSKEKGKYVVELSELNVQVRRGDKIKLNLD